MSIDFNPSRRRATIIHLIGSYGILGISTIQGLILIPLYIKYIGAKLYGIWLASGGVLAWLGIVDMGIASLAEQRIANAYGKKDLESVGLYFLYGCCIYGIISLLIISSVWILSPYIPKIFDAPKHTYDMLSTCFFLAGFAMSLSFTMNAVSVLPKALQRPTFIYALNNVGIIIKLGTTLYLILAGYSLWAIPCGQLARIIPVLMGVSFYSFYFYLKLGSPIKFKKSILMDYLKISPALFFSKTGSQLVAKIEPTLIAIFIQPEVATAFSVTKKAGEILQGFLNRFAGSVYAGFAHLYGKDEKEKAVHVFETCFSLVFWLGVLFYSTYIVANGAFVALWTGSEQFLGQTLTTLIAIALALKALNNLISYLLGATGDIAIPSILRLVEAVAQVVIMLILLPVIGVHGLPIASVISIFIFGIVFYRRLQAMLPLGSILKKFNKAFFIPCFLLIGITFIFSRFVQIYNWHDLFLKVMIFLLFVGVIILKQLPLIEMPIIKRFAFVRKDTI